MEKIIDLIEDRITDLKHEIKPLFKGNSSYEEKAEQIRFLNKLLKEVRALAEPPLNDRVLPISDVIKSVCDDFMPKFGDSVHCLWCGHSRKKHRKQTVL